MKLWGGVDVIEKNASELCTIIYKELHYKVHYGVKSGVIMQSSRQSRLHFNSLLDQYKDKIIERLEGTKGQNSPDELWKIDQFERGWYHHKFSCWQISGNSRSTIHKKGKTIGIGHEHEGQERKMCNGEKEKVVINEEKFMKHAMVIRFTEVSIIQLFSTLEERNVNENVFIHNPDVQPLVLLKCHSKMYTASPEMHNSFTSLELHLVVKAVKHVNSHHEINQKPYNEKYGEVKWREDVEVDEKRKGNKEVQQCELQLGVEMQQIMWFKEMNQPVVQHTLHKVLWKFKTVLKEQFTLQLDKQVKKAALYMLDQLRREGLRWKENFKEDIKQLKKVLVSMLISTFCFRKSISMGVGSGHKMLGVAFRCQISVVHFIEQRINCARQQNKLCKMMCLNYKAAKKKGIDTQVVEASSMSGGQNGHMILNEEVQGAGKREVRFKMPIESQHELKDTWLGTFRRQVHNGKVELNSIRRGALKTIFGIDQQMKELKKKLEELYMREVEHKGSSGTEIQLLEHELKFVRIREGLQLKMHNGTQFMQGLFKIKEKNHKEDNEGWRRELIKEGSETNSKMHFGMLSAFKELKLILEDKNLVMRGVLSQENRQAGKFQTVEWLSAAESAAETPKRGKWRELNGADGELESAVNSSNAVGWGQELKIDGR